MFDFKAAAIDRKDIIIQEKEIVSIDGEVIFYSNFFSTDESDKLFSELNSCIKWRQDKIQMFGKYLPLPRLTAWYGDEGKSYTYSGIVQHPSPWISVLSQIKERIEKTAEVSFNSVLLNLYRDGTNSVAWHSDDESELGQNPIIGSVSFGSTRRFSFKHKQNKSQKIDIDLTHGSLLLMRGPTQHHWLHQVAKTAKIVTPRINLTFRIIQ
ncbi:alpha-ketoglutarate-dependent dioxygenase AlkB [Chamaesiphon sp. VAR_48_metabat_135_sub]|uniref:alpha-ketoglutarate-dependent dioxygenase AlkB family protein n=1 Tax=Chamaesiphon sp. VAR_48_metabat_135_sub TaxID=2964699 RepID=UPI00286C1B37|nr:alpha-ketoglutarate-dependent dioxygenase AlkB [Chamaesiphon sp. VAR_48_metabat_135_sub]